MSKFWIYLTSSLVVLAQIFVCFTFDSGFYLQSPWLLWLMFLSFYASSKIMGALTRKADSGIGFSAVYKVSVPALFAVIMVTSWESVVVGFSVSPVLMPSPTAIFNAFFSNLPILWADFRQTYLKSVISGFFIGCSAGFIVAFLAARSPFLQKGLVPLGNFMSAIPIVGIAPIMVMWFGFDWQSKAAVIVVMTFFPMFINTLTGLKSVDALHRDLMHTYASSSSQIFLKNQLPQAMPFIFNALKINSTLALIGAIVAEFFGTPIVGMGFRISTEVGRMNMDMVWATILVAAIIGSTSYGLLALLERSVLFWHPAIRSGQRNK